MKQRYEKQIEQIKTENQASINGLLEEFKINLRKVFEEFKQSEDFATKLKEYYEKKLTDQEGAHDTEVGNLITKQFEIVKEQDTVVKDLTTKKSEQEKERNEAQETKDKNYKWYIDAQSEMEIRRERIEKEKQDIE